MMHQTRFSLAIAIFLGLCFQAMAQSAEPQLFPSGSDTESAAPAKDISLTTHEAAVECATAIMVEKHTLFANPRDAAFKAGVCTGKIQSFMLRAKAENPSCFPKISLEEGIGIFVKWADANLPEGESDFPEGLRKAFEDAVPCLKK